MYSFGSDRNNALETHATVKPVAVAADAIYDWTKRRRIVLCPFGGSEQP